ncbi:Hypothetical predicted protein [Octopus vulgaris]|uniref:Uncharacterized protein n=1 Tax=Octopus vulgaris TaxID=6645 RepID=A0AA36AXN0_OCTVU|nr:Hypothetical predicted protein [Octopus vulgaris]
MFTDTNRSFVIHVLVILTKACLDRACTTVMFASIFMIGLVAISRRLIGNLEDISQDISCGSMISSSSQRLLKHQNVAKITYKIVICTKDINLMHVYRKRIRIRM